MDGNIITLFVNIIYIGNVLHISGKLPCGLYRNIRIISIHFHTKSCCCVCHQNTDCSQTDHTQLFAKKLRSCKPLLLFLSHFLQIFVLSLGPYPVHTSYDISGCQQHTCDHQLFYTIRIGSRCIKYSDSLLRAFSKRNIIDACSCSSDHAELIGEFHIMHHRTSYKDCVCILHLVCLCIIPVKFFKSYLCNIIQAMILIHPTRSPLQISS